MGEATKPCHDCGVQPGEPHGDGCDTAICLWTGDQRIACDGGHDCGDDVWTGTFPGVEDCARLGYWCFWEDGRGWVRCDASHPKATPDLNRLHAGNARWDRDAQRWDAASHG